MTMMQIRFPCCISALAQDHLILKLYSIMDMVKTKLSIARYKSQVVQKFEREYFFFTKML